ncbi:sugar phosphate isomerase/epimerase [Herbaspirillum sp. Sphag1AN]|uniref:sugar phosphate isomerase/epimerase family protein n=1 Tax=unclassified Herbaspirillum TaxID=2624150 RepID=UPI001608D8DB|nr:MULTISPECIES: sugar phosphate isomerase/epimerase [unclassified Herbaspirillum]MBB3213522.1 sugar phosphate isomerase/epimerase [Herbaspirillum sp. Sphag1AN]MBB3246720.1 sugar phosphate isomerase/epimerase [Herbaspirillum sp. Sphag64]
MNLGNFGMDSITLAGPLESKLQASKAAGFSQIMLWAKDLASYPGGLDQAVRLVKESGIRVTGIQVMRDFEGLSGALHEYKLDIAKNMLQLCKAVGAPLLMVCSTTSSHADSDMSLIARHLAKLATLAVPLGVKVGFEALSWGRHINQYTQSWEAVALADHANLGVVLDSFHILANNSELDSLDDIPSHKIALVQLSDYMWRDIRSAEERLETARHLRVFPGEGTHSAELSEMLNRLDRGGYRGDFSFEVFNDDYLQLPPEIVGRRAYQSAKWVTDQVLRRSLNVREKQTRQALPA